MSLCFSQKLNCRNFRDIRDLEHGHPPPFVSLLPVGSRVKCSRTDRQKTTQHICLDFLKCIYFHRFSHRSASLNSPTLTWLTWQEVKGKGLQGQKWIVLKREQPLIWVSPLWGTWSGLYWTAVYLIMCGEKKNADSHFKCQINVLILYKSGMRNINWKK